MSARFRLSSLPVIALAFAASLMAVSAQDVSLFTSASSANGWGKGGKPKPTPTPTPNPDAQRVWGNTGTDFNTDANWTAGSGGVAPGAGDVAAFSGAEVTN